MLDRNVACANCLKVYDANLWSQCPHCGAAGRCDVNSVPSQEVEEVKEGYCQFPEDMGWPMGALNSLDAIFLL